MHLDACDRLGVAAVEVFGQPDDCRQRAYDFAALPLDVTEAFLPTAWHRSPMVPGDERNRFDFVGFEAAQVAIANQIVGVLVVALVADVHADVVQ